MNTYIFHTNLYDLLFVGMIFIGFNFALLLWFGKSVNRSANRPLALALVVMILWMLRVLAIDLRLETYLSHWDWLPMQFLLGAGPLVYFYVLKITSPDYQFGRKDLLHFSPLLIELTALVMEIRESAGTGAATYDTLTYHHLNPVLQLLIFISILTYLYQSHQLIQKFYRGLQPVIMDRSLLEFRWLRRLLVATALLWLLWIVCAAVDYLGYRNQLGTHVYYPFYIFFAVITIWTAAAAFLKPQAGLIAQQRLAPKQPAPPEMKGKGAWLKRVMEANRYYRDQELSLTSLAEKLGLTTHELSSVINTTLKKSFNDFINEYRARDVIAKMQDPAYDHITLLGIAFESGFNSQSTFYRTFKQMTGKSPVEYKNNLEKEYSSYNLGNQRQLRPVFLNHETTVQWSVGQLNRNYMFRNYLKIAFRNLLKNKGFTTINVLGLALGLATCLLIVFYVFDELSYDKYNVNADRIYRLNSDLKFGGAEASHAVAPAPAAAALKTDFPEVEQVTRLLPLGTTKVKKGAHNIQENALVYADPTVFELFTLPMISGDPKTALRNTHSIVITEKIAEKYFNTTNAVGKVLTLNDTSLYKVTGVIKNVPSQSHFHFDFFISMITHGNSTNDGWLSFAYNTYVLLRQGSDISAFKSKLPEFMRRHAGPQLGSILHLTFDQFDKSGNYFKFSLMPLTKIHLQSNISDELEANGSMQTVYIFSAIAVLILLIACVNFMNLSTARSSNRAKEVGVRKVLGSARKQLIAQFLIESIIVTSIGAVIAVFGAWAMLGLFNNLSGKQLAVTPHMMLWLLPSLLLFIIVIGCLAGSYPALYLSSFQPIQVLKGKLAAGFKGSMLRNALVVGQFVISIGLIIGTLVIYNQLQFIRNKDVGFNRDQVLTVSDTWTLGSKAKTFKNEIKQMAGVENVTLSGFLPTNGANITSSVFKDPVLDQKRAMFSELWFVDEDYIPTLKMKMMAGRNFSSQMATDSTAVIINETAAKLLAFPNPLDQKLYVPQDAMVKVLKPYHIVGVVKDFNFKSLHENVTPMVLFNETNEGAVSIRIKSADLNALVEQVKEKWNKFSPGQAFNYSFMDQDFDKLYRAEQRTGKIAISFTSLAIIIACMGLLGLAAYAAEQRTKEIGIRKVLGANLSSIVGMLSKDFIMLVLLAIIVAVPLAWYFMHRWLESYAYHQDFQWWIAAVAGFGAILIAFVTISFQSIKAALVNPVKSLRSE